jgi:hypothetical protein
MGKLFDDAEALTLALDQLLDKVEIVEIASIDKDTLDLSEWIKTTHSAINGLATHTARLTMLVRRLAAQQEGVPLPHDPMLD